MITVDTMIDGLMKVNIRRRKDGSLSGIGRLDPDLYLLASIWGGISSDGKSCIPGAFPFADYYLVPAAEEHLTEVPAGARCVCEMCREAESGPCSHP